MSPLAPLAPLDRPGYRLYVARALPTLSPKAVVLLIHGYGEHSGSYAHVIDAYTHAGYAVYTLDHRGHGQSTGTRGLVMPIPTLAEDAAAVLAQARADYPGLPVFVYGHSLGALVSLQLCLAHQRSLAGLVISGVPLALESGMPKPVESLLRALSKVAPNLAIVPERVGPEVLCSNPDALRRLSADSLRYHGRTRLGTANALLNGVADVRSRLGELTLPILAVHGAVDTLCPPDGTRIAMAGVRSADKTARFYDDMKHEPHNELEGARVLADILAWLADHIPPAAPNQELNTVQHQAAF